MNLAAAALLALSTASSSPNIEKSVAILFKQDMQGGMTMNCTATAFDKIKDKTLFLTAAHCVTNEDENHKMKVAEEPLFLSTDDLNSKTYVRADILEVGVRERGYDYAILAAPLDLPRLALGDERTEREHVGLLNVAAPRGIGKVLSFGHVALRFIDRPLIEETSKVNWSGSMLVSVSEVEGGSSGSAIVSEDTGKIIGVLVGHYASLVIAVPISRVSTTNKKNILFQAGK